MPIYDLALQELLSLSLTSTPAVSVSHESKMWVASCMLVHYLESFTDSLVVTDKEYKPIGMIGGIEVIENIFKNPSSDFFDNKIAEEIMEKSLPVISEKTTLKTLLEGWKKSKRAFSIIPNQYKGYSAVSARKLLEIGANCKTDMTVSDLPKKQAITFKYDDTMRDIITSMLENKTRKLLFKNTSNFISDRLIIQTIAQELNFLHDSDHFLDFKFEEPSKLVEAKKIDDANISEISKIMFGMLHPCALYQDQVITPWDICMALLSDKIEYNYTVA